MPNRSSAAKPVVTIRRAQEEAKVADRRPARIVATAVQRFAWHTPAR